MSEKAQERAGEGQDVRGAGPHEPETTTAQEAPSGEKSPASDSNGSGEADVEDAAAAASAEAGTADGASEDAAGDDGASSDAGSDDEVIELEIDEDDIAYYIVDEDDNEIGFAVLDEDGNEVEYYYDEGEEPLGADAKKSAEQDSEILFTREGVAQATEDMNYIYHEGKETVDELKEAYEDIMGNFGFLKKKK